MMVPGAVIKLDETHATFGEAAGEQTIGSETAIARLFQAIHLEDMARLALEIGQLGERGLHPKRQLILANACLNFRIDPLVGQHTVEPIDFLDDLALGALTDPFGIADVMNGVAFRLEKNSLKFAGQKAGGPL